MIWSRSRSWVSTSSASGLAVHEEALVEVGAGVEHDVGLGQQVGRAQGEQVGGARARRRRSGRSCGRLRAHLVTARAGVQPVKEPIGAACSTEWRVSSPPCSAYGRGQQRLGLEGHAVHDQPAARAAARRGRSASEPGRPWRRRRRRPRPGQAGRPSASGAGRAPPRGAGTPSGRRCARSAPRARRRPRPRSCGSVGCARIHSMPTDPAPAPTSQSSWPGWGASRARAPARRSRLVSWPSCSKASSGRPPVHDADARARQLDGEHVEPRRRRPSRSRRSPSTRDSSAAPRSPSTVRREAP